jgi:hypothetical protein
VLWALDNTSIAMGGTRLATHPSSSRKFSRPSSCALCRLIIREVPPPLLLLLDYLPSYMNSTWP